MAESNSNSRFDFSDMPQVRLMLGLITLLASLTGLCSNISNMANSQKWASLVACLFLFGMIVGLLFLISGFWQPKQQSKIKMSFRPDGNAVFGYDKQYSELCEVIRIAGEETNINNNSPVLLVAGRSGVGKSSLLDKLKDSHLSDGQVVIANLREGAAHIMSVLGPLFDTTSDNVLTAHALRDRIKQFIDNRIIANKLSRVVLVIDQFEQTNINPAIQEYADCLFNTLGPHCQLTIVSVRSDVLGNAVNGIHSLLFSAVNVYRRVRVFEVLPLVADTPEFMNMLYGIWADIFKGIEPDVNLMNKLAKSFKDEADSRGVLPIFIRLAFYALRDVNIKTLPEFNARAKCPIKTLIANMLDKYLANTPNKNLALRILFSLANENDVAEQFEPDHLRQICSVEVEKHEHVVKLLKQMEDMGLIVRVANACYSISHEYLASISKERAKVILAPAEQEQLFARQKLIRRQVSLRLPDPYISETLLDTRERVRLRSIESIVVVASIVVSTIRLLKPTIHPVSSINLDHSYAPAALSFAGAAFYYWLLYGNVGRAFKSDQSICGNILWNCVLLCPVFGVTICAIWPQYWLLAGSFITLITATNQWNVGRWAKQKGSEDTAYTFNRYAITTICIAIMLAMTQLLAVSAAYSDHMIVASVVFSLLVLSSLTWWRGRNLRSLLARVDIDIKMRNLY